MEYIYKVKNTYDKSMFFTPFVHIIIRIKLLLSDILLKSSIPKLYLYRFIFHLFWEKHSWLLSFSFLIQNILTKRQKYTPSERQQIISICQSVYIGGNILFKINFSKIAFTIDFTYYMINYRISLWDIIAAGHSNICI